MTKLTDKQIIDIAHKHFEEVYRPPSAGEFYGLFDISEDQAIAFAREIEEMVMTDEQLLEEYSKEFLGEYYYGSKDNITVKDLIRFHRENINLKRDLNKHYQQYQKEGYEHGHKIALMHVQETTIQYEDLRKMSIQQLANLIGTDD